MKLAWEKVPSSWPLRDGEGQPRVRRTKVPGGWLSQENKLLLQPDVGDVGHPKLIDPGQRPPFRQIRVDFAAGLLSVVTTNLRFRRHSRLSSRIRR